MEIIAVYLIFAMLATIWFDVTSYIIPNWLSGSLLVLYPIAVILSPASSSIDWPMSLLAMLLVFFVGYFLFNFRVMGGGDIKLITVLALWVGWSGLLDFIFTFAIFGGIFSIFLLLMRRVEPYLPWRKRFKTPKIFEKNAPIPYGVAISAAFLFLMNNGKIPALVFI